MKLAFGNATHVGSVRDNNEDFVLVDEALQLFIVCDGMGGHSAGDVAARKTAEIVQEHVRIAAQDEADEGDAASWDTEAWKIVLHDAVLEANHLVHEMSRELSEAGGTGTTCTALLFRGGRALIAHVGDSRLYMLRGDKLHQLTEDHTFVAEAMRAGLYKKGDPRIAALGNIVTRAIGPVPEVLIDMISLDVLAGDRFLGCSDGLYEYFTEENELGALMGSEDQLESIGTRLVELANERGGHDNITALLVEVEALEQSRSSAGLKAVQHVELFDELSVSELSQVLARCEHITAELGQAVVTQGDRGDSLYILMSGQLSVTRDGDEVAQLVPGSHFGEMALLNQRPRSASVTATETSELLCLPRNAFYELVQQSHLIGVKFLWKLAQTLSTRLDERFDTPEQAAEFRKTLDFEIVPSPFP